MNQATATMFELADRLLDLRERKEQLSELLKQVNAEIEEVDRQLAELMLSEEIQSFVRSGQMFYLKTETYVSTAAGRKPALIQWRTYHGLRDVVQETVHPCTPAATLTAML